MTVLILCAIVLFLLVIEICVHFNADERECDEEDYFLALRVEITDKNVLEFEQLAELEFNGSTKIRINDHEVSAAILE